MGSHLHQDTHRWSLPYHSCHVFRIQYIFTDGHPVRGEHIVDVPYPVDDTILFQHLEVLVEKLLRVGNSPKTIFLVPCINDVHTHTWWRHRCSVWALLRKENLKYLLFFLWQFLKSRIGLCKERKIRSLHKSAVVTVSNFSGFWIGFCLAWDTGIRKLVLVLVQLDFDITFSSSSVCILIYLCTSTTFTTHTLTHTHIHTPSLLSICSFM